MCGCGTPIAISSWIVNDLYTNDQKRELISKTKCFQCGSEFGDLGPTKEEKELYQQREKFRNYGLGDIFCEIISKINQQNERNK